MDKLVTIATFEFPVEARTMMFLLEERGYQVVIADDNLISTDWFLAGAVGGVKLQVPESQADRAAAFVEQKRENASEKNNRSELPDVSFACEECGKMLTFPGHRRGKTESCSHCHEFVDVPD